MPYEKVGKNEPVCIADEVPFEIPESWEWVRLGTILHKLSDGTHSRPRYVASGIPFISVKDVSGGKLDFSDCKYITAEEHRELYSRCNPEYGDILLTKVGTTGIPVLVDTTNEFSLFVSVALLKFNQEILSNEYLVCLINSPLVQKQAEKNTRGVGNKNWVMRDIANTLIVIPPLLEQKRIVSKLQEILPFVDNYAHAYSKVEELNNSFTELLKKSILQEAVQGKLVPQDLSDEPASVLLERIRAEKERLIQEGKIKRDKHESIIYRRDNSHYEKLDGIERCIDDEIPFEIPESWEWTRLGQVILLLSGTDFKPEEYNDKCKGIPYITGASSLSENGVLTNRWTETPKVIANYGDVLLVCKGSGYGKTVICDIEKAHIARQIMAIRNVSTFDMLYIRLFLQANFDQIKSKGQGVIPGIDRNSVMNMLLPIPPLAEQKHIVEKQRELFDKISLI